MLIEIAGKVFEIPTLQLLCIGSYQLRPLCYEAVKFAQFSAV